MKRVGLLLLLVLVIASAACARKPAPGLNLTTSGPAANKQVPDATVGRDVVVVKGERAQTAVSVMGDVTVSGSVTEDAVAVLGNTTVSPGASVDGDSVAVMGSVKIGEKAHVRGDAVAVGGNVELMPGARVDGDVVAVGGRVTQAEGATVGGEVTNVRWGDWVPTGISACNVLGPVMVAWMVWSFLLLLLLSVAIAALFPTRLRMISSGVTERPGQSFLYGLLGCLATIPVGVFLLVTIIGIPLIAVEVMLVTAAWIMGAAGVGLAIGKRLLEAMHRPNAGVVGATALGALVLSLLNHVPFVGGLVHTVLVLLGFGSVIMTGFGSDPDWLANRWHRSPRQPSTIAPVEPRPYAPTRSETGDSGGGI